MRRFDSYACFDWSGQAVARPAGIALAVARAGVSSPALVASGHRWSRQAALDWIEARIEARADMLIGCDFSFALPFVDHGAYFPGWEHSPSDARALWSLVEQRTAEEPHLSASSFATHRKLARHFRTQRGKAVQCGDLFEGGLGRLRLTEQACRDQGLGNAASCFNLIGASQVGKSSFTGMRLLDRLVGRIAIWPFDPLPDTGPVLVEIYTAIAARSAGLTGPTKLRDPNSLDAALNALDSVPHAPLARYDDHSTDALLGAAWLRRASAEAALWQPADLALTFAQTEGWTFGVR